MSHKKIFYTLTVIISFFLIACHSSLGKGSKEINIVDIRNSEEPKVNLASHKAHDVEVFRIIFMGEGYKVRYYRKEKDTLAKYEASFMINEDFDKAAYKWLSDNTVHIRLFNRATNKEKKFKLFGKGTTSGIKD